MQSMIPSLTKHRYALAVIALLGAMTWLLTYENNQELVQETPSLTATSQERHSPRPALTEERDSVDQEKIQQQPLTTAELLPPPQDLSNVDLSDLPAGTIAFERYTLDELRESEGLPAIDAALIAMEDFPEELPHQRANPDLHRFYQLEKELHRTKYLAKHKIVERNRFWAQAQTEGDEARKELLLSSAKYHARLAAKQKRRHTKLLQDKANFAVEFEERR